MDRNLGELVTTLQPFGHQPLEPIGSFAGIVVLAKVKRLDDRESEYWG